MKVLSEPSFTIEIYLAGNLVDIERCCAEFCMSGLCVSIEAVKFVYTGGREDGAVVRLVNYPRFPSNPDAIRERARALTVALLDSCCQHSALLVDRDCTEWMTRREEA